MDTSRQVSPTGAPPPYQLTSGQSNQDCAGAFSRNVSPAASPSAMPPPYESLSDVPPPGLTPFAGAVQVSAQTDPNLAGCLVRMQRAYGVDFAHLAEKNNFKLVHAIGDGFKRMALEVTRANGSSESEQLRVLAARLEKLYLAAEWGIEDRENKIKLAFIVTVFMLEQKVLLTGSEAGYAEDQKRLASSVRKDFFHRLTTIDWRAAGRRIAINVNEFLDANPGLSRELKGEVPEPTTLMLSGLRLGDIPGTVASAGLRSRLQMLSQQYGVDFTSLIEAMGDSGSRGISAISDFVRTALTDLTQKISMKDPGWQRHPRRKYVYTSNGSFLDRNAKLVFAAMGFFQGEVFYSDASSSPPVPGEKCPPGPHPCPVAAGVDDKIAEVRRRFIQFLLSVSSNCDRNDIYENVKAHVQCLWPAGSLPELPEKT